MAPLIAEALKVLGQAMDREDLWSRKLLAVETVLHLAMMPASKLPPSEGGSFLFGPPVRRRPRPPRSEGLQADR